MIMNMKVKISESKTRSGVKISQSINWCGLHFCDCRFISFLNIMAKSGSGYFDGST